jgi:hypothetical protein
MIAALMSAHLGTLTQRSVTKIGPLGTPIRCEASLKQVPLQTGAPANLGCLQIEVKSSTSTLQPITTEMDFSRKNICYHNFWA